MFNISWNFILLEKLGVLGGYTNRAWLEYLVFVLRAMMREFISPRTSFWQERPMVKLDMMWRDLIGGLEVVIIFHIHFSQLWMEGSSQKPENDELPHGIQEISPPVVPVSKQSVTPLPWGKVFIVCMIQFCDALSVTAVFPYLGQMTADLMGLDYERDANLVGYYAGMIASFYFVAQFLTSPIWGYISDRWGRKYLILSD